MEEESAMPYYESEAERSKDFSDIFTNLHQRQTVESKAKERVLSVHIKHPTLHPHTCIHEKQKQAQGDYVQRIDPYLKKPEKHIGEGDQNVAKKSVVSVNKKDAGVSNLIPKSSCKY